MTQRCCQSIKDSILKANHNGFFCTQDVGFVSLKLERQIKK